MSVYVDWLMDHGWTLRGRRVKSCHMTADTPEELHAMAEAIGMKRSWYQSSPPHSLPHYDLTPSRRADAVARGAVELDRKTLCPTFRRIREHYPQDTP